MVQCFNCLSFSNLSTLLIFLSALEPVCTICCENKLESKIIILRRQTKLTKKEIKFSNNKIPSNFPFQISYLFHENFHQIIFFSSVFDSAIVSICLLVLANVHNIMICGCKTRAFIELFTLRAICLYWHYET